MARLTPHEIFVASETCVAAFKASFSVHAWGRFLKRGEQNVHCVRRAFARARHLYFKKRGLWWLSNTDLLANMDHFRIFLFPFLTIFKTNAADYLLGGRICNGPWVGNFNGRFFVVMYEEVEEYSYDTVLFLNLGFSLTNIKYNAVLDACNYEKFIEYQLFDGTCPDNLYLIRYEFQMSETLRKEIESVFI